MIYIHIYENKNNPKLYSREKLAENLSYYLDIKATELKIQRNKNGKPSIDGIDFSISHSQHIIVQAFSKLGNIGIDVEYINTKRRYLQIAQRYFHPDEYQHLQNLPPASVLTVFYNLWTAKEAICKAQGGRLWYYLADNYLTDNNNIAAIVTGLNLCNFDIVQDFTLAIASTGTIADMVFIRE